MPTREWGLPCILKAKERGKKKKKGKEEKKKGQLTGTKSRYDVRGPYMEQFGQGLSKTTPYELSSSFSQTQSLQRSPVSSLALSLSFFLSSFILWILSSTRSQFT